MPPILLDRSSTTPLHRQIQAQIEQAVRTGAITNGIRLPSTRLLARLLRVSRNTVFAAYEELAADDLIRPERGVGMRVNNHAAAPQMSWSALRKVIQAASYPARVLAFEDPDGNALYFRF